MKVSLVTDGIYPYVIGGMQKHSYYLAKYFAQQKVYVEVYHYVPSDREDMPVPFTQDELKFIQLIKIDYPNPEKFPGHYLYERYQYSKAVTQALVKRDATDFIYAKGFSAWHLLRYRNKLRIKQSVGVNFHGYEMFQRWPDFATGMKLQILKYPVYANMKRANYLFSYGGKISDLIKTKGFKNKIITIPTGIDANWLSIQSPAYDTQTIKFCFVGRFERRKGIEELNHVLSSLGDEFKFEFHFIGPIPEAFRFKDNRIQYHGPVYDQEQIQTILQSIDILVCPSYSEGMPNVILEGMASGCAIIATDVGAVSEMVDSSNGFLIEGNIIEGLKNAFAFFFSLDSSELNEMKLNSIKKVKERFTWDKVIKETILKIEECL
ncbi:glycosyltransferase family 4 protein [Algoriphagus formosus]|uniref:glycosyltransferase family 4 protein n=1 Tax=Algoriphagus formosus TaxID=2007308 RepID=UPI000C28A1E1|nr:glycosyltransferase family 4 protein [Algoriphagus formosus]